MKISFSIHIPKVVPTVDLDGKNTPGRNIYGVGTYVHLAYSSKIGKIKRVGFSAPNSTALPLGINLTTNLPSAEIKWTNGSTTIEPLSMIEPLKYKIFKHYKALMKIVKLLPTLAKL